MISKLFGLCASFVLLIIVADGSFLEDCLKVMVINREWIHGIFQPVEELCSSQHSVIYKGKSKIDKRPVAMKFSEIERYARHEYAMYTYLNAIETDVEKYGIPNIYYFNKFEFFYVLVLSHFEYDLETKAENVEIQPIDYLIVFRDFVRQSKYLHSRRIRHDDVKPENIMFRNHRSFLIDFNGSSQMKDFSEAGTYEYQPRSVFSDDRVRTALDDWESFLYAMSEVNNVKLKFLTQREVTEKSRMNTTETIERINNTDMNCDHLKEVFLEFANHALKEDRSPPDYNYFDTLIMEKIEIVRKEKGMELALFTWLSIDEREKAAEDLKKNPPAKAAEIVFEEQFEPPDVEYDYFDLQKDEMALGHPPNRANYLNKKRAKEAEMNRKAGNSKKGRKGKQSTV